MAAMPAPPSAPPPRSSTGARSGQLRAVAAFEAAKGVAALLSAGGLGWLGAPALQRTVETLALRLGMPLDGARLAWLERMLDPHTLHLAMAILALYASLRFVEAWGLWRMRAWASWLGCIGAAIYLPFEIRELIRSPGWLPATVFAVNLAIVWILARDLLRRRRDD